MNQIDVLPTAEEKRAAWLEARRGAIGASEVAAIIGVSPWATPWEVWAEKRGLLESFDNPATSAGRALEPVVLDYAEKNLGELVRDVRVKHHSLPLASTCDARVLSTGCPVEAKTTGITGPIVGDWGDELTDQIPDYYLVQVHAQLMCTGTDLAYLFALLPGRGFCEFRIESNETFNEHVGNILSDWWEHHIVQGNEPSLTVMPGLEIIRRLKKTPNKMIEASPFFEAALKLREEAKAAEKLAKEQVEEIEAKLLIELGDAEAATLSDGRTFTYLETKRKSYTVAETVYRSIRIKKGRS